MRPLAEKVALVAGATRGAGRGIACMLGEAGATVYCTGRSSRGGPPPATGPYAGRRETIEETAEMVDAAGGVGIPARVDHGVETEVAALAERVRRERGRLDVLVIDFWGDEAPVEFGKRFWTLSLEKGRATIDSTLWPHVITARHLVPLMLEGRRGGRRGPGLVVEVAEGPSLHYRTSLFYDLAAVLRIRLAYAMAEELAPHGITALAVTPGYLRSEATLDRLGVTEDTWREGAAKDPDFLASETPFFLGRGVAALATDPDVARKAGGLYGSWALAQEYGFTDVDGARPDLGRHFAERYGESPAPLYTPVRWQLGRAIAGNVTSAPDPGERVRDVRFSADALSVDLADGRTVTAPLEWFPRLLNATPEQRSGWQVCGGGYGIHWPAIDEDLSTEGLLRGARAPRRASH